MPKKLLDIALKHLAESLKQDHLDDTSVRKSLEKAVHDSEQRITNLNRMRINDLIDDEEYRAEKQKLLSERIRLEENGNGNITGEEKPDESPEEMITFASAAKMRFRAGTVQEKRSVFRRIGSNFFLKDRKLEIKARKALIILEKGLRGVGGENDWLELLRKSLLEPQITLSEAQIMKWWAVVEDVRTCFKENQAVKTTEIRR